VPVRGYDDLLSLLDQTEVMAKLLLQGGSHCPGDGSSIADERTVPPCG